MAVDGPVRRHALALRPGHIAVLTGLRPLDPSPGPRSAEPMDVDGSTHTLVWTEVCMNPADPACKFPSLCLRKHFSHDSQDPCPMQAPQNSMKQSLWRLWPCRN